MSARFTESTRSSARRSATSRARSSPRTPTSGSAAEIFPREVFKPPASWASSGSHYPEERRRERRGDYWYTVVYGEELPTAGSAGLNMALMVQSDMATPIIGELGTKEQKEEFLVPAIRGEKIAALGVSEPDAAPTSRDPHHRASATATTTSSTAPRRFITNGTRADFITLAVRTGDEGYARRLAARLPHRRQGLPRVAASSRRSATTPPTPPSSPSRTAASRRATSSARRTRASTTS